jgi:DNA invertase Pin-like site-specific DNA recombinase
MGKSRYKVNNEIKNRFKCAAYIRLSREDGDKEESNSVTSQREIIDYFLKNEKEIELFDYYIDDGFTGTNFKRPSFKRMIDDLQNKKINTIIVKDLSRFGRNYIEVGNFIEEVIPKYNVRFIAISDKIDNYKEPESLNNMIIPFKNMINEEYSRDLSRKVKSAKMIRVKKGDFMAGQAPYGYIKNPKNKHRFIIDPVASKIVKLIFDMFMNGNGYTTIVRYLNDNNILPPSRYKCEVQNINYRSPFCNADNIKDMKWKTNTVRRILNNQVYCGDQIQCRERVLSHKNHKIVKNHKEDWVIVENTHKAIISREDFDKVKQIIKSKAYSGEINSQPNIYAGHLYCAKCGKFMIRKYTGHRRSNPEIMNYNYYCSTYARTSHNQCIKNKVRNEELDEIVIKAIKQQIKLYLKVDMLMQEIACTKIDNNNNTKIILNNLDKEINEKRKIKQKFYEDWKTGVITKDEYIKYVHSTEDTINLLNERYKKYSKKLEEEEKIKNERDIFKDIKRYENIKVLNKNIVDDFIDKIYANEGHIEIRFKYQDEYNKLTKIIKQFNLT